MLRGITVALAALLAGSAFAQAPVPAAPVGSPPADDSYVVEWERRQVHFEDDGRGTIELKSRVHLGSDAGVRQWGQLVKVYNAANESLEFRDVRVLKKDGTRVDVAPGRTLEVNSPVAQSFPVYTDQREKHLVIPDLAAGDALEYTALWTVHTPLAPGEFWYNRSLFTLENVRALFTEISVPRRRTVQAKAGAGATLEVSEEGDRRVYRFTARALGAEELSARRRLALRLDDVAPPPDINLSSLSDWAALGRWYQGLQQDRLRPTPEIKAKAADVTRGLGTDFEKVHALYDYVATHFRYVSLSLGDGGVQPHPPAQTLANGYGDCKDKHTLLAALLAAVGIEADAALVSSRADVDTGVASLQFDHMISAVHVGGEVIWLDTTAEVAPFRWLAPALRGQPALLVPARGPARLVTTPREPLVASALSIELAASVDDSGRLAGTEIETYRGDPEVGARAFFRLVPAEQRQVAMEKYLRGESQLGSQAEAVAITAEDPAATRTPFAVRVSFSRPGWIEWKDAAPSLRLPTLMRGLPDSDLPLKRDGRLSVGGPVKVTVVARVELPAGWSPVLPAPTTLQEPFASYSSVSRFEGHTMVVERTLSIASDTLPASAEGAVLGFTRAVRADAPGPFPLRNTAGVRLTGAGAEAGKEYDAAWAARRKGDLPAAVEGFKRAVELAPAHADAWNDLGNAYIDLRQADQAIEALRKQIAAVPLHRYAHNNLGRALRLAGRKAEAEAAFKKAIEIDADERWAHKNLGDLYMEERRIPEAMAEFETAARIDPRDAGVPFALGRCYLDLGRKEKAMTAFENALALDPTPARWNNAAYLLAEAGLALERAQEWAESAVVSAAARLRSVPRDRIGINEVTLTVSLADYWDTLGWIHYKRGDLKAALPYLRAAAAVTGRVQVIEHLRAAGAKAGVPGTPPREMDEVHLPRPAACSGMKCSALALYVGLGSSGTVTAATPMTANDESLKPAAAAVVGLRHRLHFPDATPTQLVMGGALVCPPAKADCALAVIPPTFDRPRN